MNQIEFTKMSGAGNDFVVVDNRDGKIPEEGRKELLEYWCMRRMGVGADGALLVEPAREGADFRMRYYNSDGGEAESCGNGARCIARFANLIGAAGEKMSFETEAGLYQAVMVGEDVRLTMSDPVDLKRDIPLKVSGVPNDKADFINTGVPHVVVFVDKLMMVDVQSTGSALRYHEAFEPKGTNANFAMVTGENKLSMRTYERGVEAETLACGTGAIAVALIAHLKGLAQSPVEITTSGGPVLKIYFDADGDKFSNVRLEGEARVVFNGTLG